MIVIDLDVNLRDNEEYIENESRSFCIQELLETIVTVTS